MKTRKEIRPTMLKLNNAFLFDNKITVNKRLDLILIIQSAGNIIVTIKQNLINTFIHFF